MKRIIGFIKKLIAFMKYVEVNENGIKIKGNLFVADLQVYNIDAIGIETHDLHSKGDIRAEKKISSGRDVMAYENTELYMKNKGIRLYNEIGEYVKERLTDTGVYNWVDEQEKEIYKKTKEEYRNITNFIKAEIIEDLEKWQKIINRAKNGE